MGCGNWGKNLIRVLDSLGSLAGICDLDTAKASLYSQQFHVPALGFDELLTNNNIHAVFIATPSHTHFDVALACLKANKHVYIEKPFAHELTQAITLHKLAKERHRTIMIGHLLQYHSAFIRLKQLVHEGEIGALQYIFANRFNFGKFPSEESVLMDYAPHDISMILSLVKTLPTMVMASNANILQHTVSDTTSIQLTFDNNIKAHIFSSWLYPYKEQKMIVVGTKGMAIFEDSQPWESKVRLCPYPTTWQDGLPHPIVGDFKNLPVTPSEPLLNECSHFLDCIAKQIEPITSSYEALNVMAVLEASKESMQQQSPVRLTEKPSTLPQRMVKQPLAEALF